jgi:hypothetical protein
MISTKERNNLIGRISRASGIAQYALKEKMTDEQVLEAFDNLRILELIRESNNYNRYRQGLKTEEANSKLKYFIHLDNSEVIKAGKWLLNAVSLTGKDRSKTLIEKELVHKDSYNEMLLDTKDTIITLTESSKASTEKATEVIKSLQIRNDILRKEMSLLKEYVCNNYGIKEWKGIEKTFNIGYENHENN